MKTKKQWEQLGYVFTPKPVGLVQVTRTDGKSFYYFNPKYSPTLTRAFNNMTTERDGSHAGPKTSLLCPIPLEFNASRLFSFELVSLEQFEEVYCMIRAVIATEDAISVLQEKMASLKTASENWLTEFSKRD